MSLEEEMARRTAIDGIPRYITRDGKIMKCDWDLAGSDFDLDPEALEEYIAKLIAEQS